MTFQQDWFSTNIPVWENVLKKFKGKPGLSFLEIGCFEGRSTLWLLTNILTHPTSKITVMDTFSGSSDGNNHTVNFRNLLQRFKDNVSDFISTDPAKIK
jgi:hypothetical protein